MKNFLKKIYYLLCRVPVVGKVAVFFAPHIKMLVHSFTRKSVSTGELLAMLDMQGKALQSFRDSYGKAVTSMHALLQETTTATQKAINANRTEFQETMNALHHRVEFIRLELFQQYGAPKHGATSQGRIIAVDKWRTQHEAGAVRLNIGCGHKPCTDYLNVDVRELPSVDIVAEAGGIPLEPESVAVIRCAHLLEHFTEHELQNRLLPHWLSLLQPGGRLIVCVPDAEAMIDDFVNGRIPFENLKEVTFGLQEYDEDTHHTMFSKQSLRHLLCASGFSMVQWNAENRSLGKCREMEIEVCKPL